ncbi:hypothetical protein SDC9_183395 [bioreactor metagenome]|uniref:Uncharacterized protein n=1 Tax=bioreactor metagenome TaxID=1076179 RepID=A0A645HJR8_9ZZZZ
MQAGWLDHRTTATEFLWSKLNQSSKDGVSIRLPAQHMQGIRPIVMSHRTFRGLMQSTLEVAQGFRVTAGFVPPKTRADECRVILSSFHTADSINLAQGRPLELAKDGSECVL